MARRKDHSPEKLKDLIRSSAVKFIHIKGLRGLTARGLARSIGYAPGTIYNFFRDMDALVTEVNFTTLQELERACVANVRTAPSGFPRVRALAYTYVDFASENEPAWRTLFIETNRARKPTKLPAAYQQCLRDLFTLLETTLETNLAMPHEDAAHAARLLWAALHGITSLMLDGRLSLLGIDKPHVMIDDLLQKYLASYIPHIPREFL